MALLRVVQHAAWGYGAADFLSAVETVRPEQRIAVVIGAGLVSSVGLLLMRRAWPRDSSLSAAIWFHGGRLPFVRTVGHAVLSIVIVALGASLGREGAPKDVGGAYASVLADRFRLPTAQRRVLVACAAGAGLAAVYNVPLGGALFACEILLGTLALPVVLPAFVASMVATGVSWIALPMQPTYSIPNLASSWSLLAWAMAFGPAAGLSSVVYIRMLSWAQGLKFVGQQTVFASLTVFTLLGVASTAFPQLLGNGKNVVQLAFTDNVAIRLLVALLVLKVLATIGCVGTGAPGGLFTPTLTFGALLGGSLGHVWNSAWPIALPGSYAVIGASAVLAAATLGPVSAVVLVLELTHHIEGLIVPLLLAVAGATVTARLLRSRSLYSSNLHGDLSRECRDQSRARTAFEGILSADYLSISASKSVTHASDELLESGCDRLYVVDEQRRLIGVADRTAIDGAPLIPKEVSKAGDIARPISAVHIGMHIEDVRALIQSENVRELPVLDESGRIIGVVKMPFFAPKA